MAGKELPGGLQIAPSLLAADFGRLVEEIHSVEMGGVRILHLDVMDGNFVPNITFGPPLVRAIRRATGLFLDTHLMIRDPLAFLKPFAEAGSDLLTLHAEALCEDRAGDPSDEALSRFERAVELLRGRGCLVGLSFRPATDPHAWLDRVGTLLDLVLVMTVEPGFGGQTFMHEMLPRVETVSRLARERGWHYRVEVDGGIGAPTAGACVRAGAEILAVGTAVFGEADRPSAIRSLRQATAI